MSGGRAGGIGLAWAVARRDYLRTVRRRGFLVATFTLPLTIAGFLLLGAVVGSTAVPAGGGPVPIVVVAETAVDLRGAAALVPGVTLTDRATAEARSATGEIPAWYLVPAGWPAAPTVIRTTGAAQPIDLGDAGRESAEQASLDALLRLALTEAGGLDAAARERILLPAIVETRTEAGATVSAAALAASFIVPFAFALLFVLAIFVTSGYLLQSVTEEKENRVVEIVLSSVPAFPLMGGKILGLGAAGLTQATIWAVTALIGIALLGDRLGGLPEIVPDPLVVLLAASYFVLGYLAFGAIFAAIGALAPGTREAQQYSGFLGFFAVLPLVLSAGIASDAGSPLVWALAAIPLTAPSTLLLVLALGDGIPWPMVGLSLVSLGGWIILATAGSARVFRATILLYGARPSVRSIVDALLARG